MSSNHDGSRTAVLLIDPYNDFLSEGGKLWPRVQPVADAEPARQPRRGARGRP